MSKKGERICVLCKKKYQFCPVCNPEDNLKPTWYFCWCSDNCHDIDIVTSAFEDKRITNIEAKKKLEELDLSRKEYFGESYQKSIASIMKAKPQIIKKENRKTEVTSIKKDIITKVENEAESNVE